MAKRINSVVKHRRVSGTYVAPARQAIRCFCLECVGYQQAEVARCTAPECHLWPYRFGPGRNPEAIVDSEGKIA